MVKLGKLDTTGDVRMSESVYDAVLEGLRAAPAAQTCADVKKALWALGFEVQDRKRGNHKTYTHSYLARVARFYGADFDCGHGRTLLPVYVRNIVKVLVKYETELRVHLGE